MIQFQFGDDLMYPSDEFSLLHARHSDANLSTSVGTHRSELSKEQIMQKVHKEMRQVLDVLG